MSTHRCLRNPNGSYRKADRNELMTDNDWDIVRSYNEQRSKRADWAEAEGTQRHVLVKYGRCVVFKVKMEWDKDAGHRELHPGRYVESDTVRITYYTKSKADKIVEASREWARAHYRALLADGYQVPQRKS